MESGEKITIGIVAIPEKGNPVVRHVLNHAQVTCAFGESGLDLLDSASLCLEILTEHLHEQSSLTTWTPPLYGVTLGLERLAAGDSIEEILQMAMRSSASFSASFANGEVVLGEQFRELDTWERKIEEIVVGRAPDLKQHFHQSFSVIEGIANTKFDYLGDRYVANFGKVRHPSSVNSAKSKLLSLINLAETQSKTLPGPKRPKVELIVLRSPLNGENLQGKRPRNTEEVIIELTETCRRHDLKTFPVENADEAGEHIIAMERMVA